MLFRDRDFNQNYKTIRAKLVYAPPSTSLHRIAGRVFFNLFGAAKVVANRRVRSAQALGCFF